MAVLRDGRRAPRTTESVLPDVQPGLRRDPPPACLARQALIIATLSLSGKPSAQNRGARPATWSLPSAVPGRCQARTAKAVAQYKAARQAVHAALSDGQTSTERFCALGREYGEAFNKLDQGKPFIETEEREDLFRALMYIMDEAAAQAGSDPFTARDNLIAGLESVRKW